MYVWFLGHCFENFIPKNIMKITIVIPALNEEKAIGAVLDQIPVSELNARGYEVEKLVVDNGSTDNTVSIAKKHGAVVVNEQERGYGNAYKTGFARASGDIVVTGDADMTYPFDELPELMKTFEQEQIDFMTTDRLTTLGNNVMTKTHVFGNWVLSTITRILFNWPFKDSQSGMWVFKRSIWPTLDVPSTGMPFSQEIKIEAYIKGHRCTEVPVTYRARVGEVKLSTFKDGFFNTLHLFTKYMKTLKGDTVLIKRIITESRRVYR